MKLYGYYLILNEDTPQDIKDATECQLNNIISTLNSKYNEDCKIKPDVDEYDYFIATTNFSLIDDLIQECDTYLRENTIKFIIEIALIDILKFTQTSKNSEIQDILDLLKEYFTISPALATNNYFIDDINYFQMATNSIIYKINLKAKSPNQLRIKIACLLDETDSINISNIASVLANAYDDILNKMPNLTKEKNVQE